MLKEVAKTNEGNAFRYGGEEFFLLFPEKDEKTSVPLAELLRSLVENDLVVSSEGHTITITVSIGISTFPSDGKRMDDLYKAADEALYVAKRSGRNKVIHASEIEVASLETMKS